MHTLLIPLTIFLAVIAAVVLANIITFLIGGGGTLYRSVEPVTEQSTNQENSFLSGDENDKAERCDCPCHSQQMFPGMRCMDCFNQPCDEGTAQ